MKWQYDTRRKCLRCASDSIPRHPAARCFTNCGFILTIQVPWIKKQLRISQNYTESQSSLNSLFQSSTSVSTTMAGVRRFVWTHTMATVASVERAISLFLSSSTAEVFTMILLFLFILFYTTDYGTMRQGHCPFYKFHSYLFKTWLYCRFEIIFWKGCISEYNYRPFEKTHVK